ncbi:MAG TPA: ribonuclease P protein component [Woeseiaceae bacterium]|nr:ribonuclease P protein component [Woeseiaceae bacterium]
MHSLHRKLHVHPAATTTETREGPAKNKNRGRHRLRKPNRLPDAAAFGRVFRGARKSRDHFFTVLFKANGTRVARLGLAISKKHCRLASGRNRLKRIVRESFRSHQEDLAGLDIVVIGQAAASGAENRTLFDSLDGHWQTIRRAGTR